ncbi:MAG: SDR family oxidoreductase [Calditrichaeota bacterium]|nr:MAG: SDR family oxidoreductase [Calditrichota bacterium]
MMRILITGVNGYLGWYLLRHKPRGVTILGSTRRINETASPVSLIPLELKQPVGPQLKMVTVDAVIHTAALSSLAVCEQQPEEAYRINARATDELAAWCRERNIFFLYLSTDIVFDGEHAPYRPQDTPRPVNEYGRSKAEGEQAIMEKMVKGSYAIARLPLLLGRSPHKKNFVDWLIQNNRAGQECPVFYDEIRTPLSTDDAVRALWQIISSKQSGTHHLTSGIAKNRWQMAMEIAREYNLDKSLFRKVSVRRAGVPRPRDVRLSAG